MTVKVHKSLNEISYKLTVSYSSLATPIMETSQSLKTNDIASMAAEFANSLKHLTGILKLPADSQK
jgi:hypothetical protein